MARKSPEPKLDEQQDTDAKPTAELVDADGELTFWGRVQMMNKLTWAFKIPQSEPRRAAIRRACLLEAYESGLEEEKICAVTKLSIRELRKEIQLIHGAQTITALRGRGRLRDD